MDESIIRTEQAEAQEYRKRILTALETSQAQNSRLLRLIRILIILVAAGTVCIAAGALWLIPNLQQSSQSAKMTLEKVDQLTEQLNEMDFEQIESDLTDLLEEAAETARVVSKTGETAQEIDIENLNKAIRNLAAATEALNAVDFSKLAKAVQTMKDAVDALSSITILGKPLFG